MKRQHFTSQKAYVTYLVIALGMALILGVQYLRSFTTVEFHYNTTVGSISIKDPNGNVSTPPANQPIRLKKGDYVITPKGDNIDDGQFVRTIDDTTEIITINLHYTRVYLDKLYASEQLPIYTALLLQYPAINKEYTISNGRLYGTGEWFGASLVANNHSSDNRDTLHVIMQKKDTTWQVTSTPPHPVLGAPDFPDVPYNILKAINRE